jgi:diadenosine tetraphosphatase ApaH/serine/threonine PP2A family protein phosphatase
MLIAVLADIHGNREALDACLADAGFGGAERYVFLGDLVGYGADPVYVIDRVAAYAAAGAVVILGNHDAAVADGGEGMNPVARAAIDWTRAQLDMPRRGFLAGLPLEVREGDLLFVHAEASAPRDWIYVVSTRQAQASLAATTAPITFCGHVHRPQLYGMAPRRPASAYAAQPFVGIALDPPRRWLAVLGAVGQPRDRNPEASYALFDTVSRVLTFHRVAYDVEAAAAKILAAGLPPALAHRLFVGL